MKGMMLAGFMIWGLLTPVKAEDQLSILVGGTLAGFVKFQRDGVPLYQLHLQPFKPGNWFRDGVFTRVRVPLPKLLIWWQIIDTAASEQIIIQRKFSGLNSIYTELHRVAGQSQIVTDVTDASHFSLWSNMTLLEALEGRSMCGVSNTDIYVYDPLLYWTRMVLTPDYSINNKTYTHNEPVKRQWSTLLKVNEHNHMVSGSFFDEPDLTPLFVTALYQKDGQLKSYEVSIGTLPTITFKRMTLDEKKKEENTEQSDNAIKPKPVE